MFKNKELTEKFFDLMYDSRNLSYEKYDEDFEVISNVFIFGKETLINNVEKEDFDFFYSLGKFIVSGNFEELKNFLNKSGRQAEVAFITRCFTLAKYLSRGKAKIAFESLSDFVNIAGGEKAEMAKLMANDHPALQGEMLQLFILFCKEMAAKTYVDDRNRWAATLAKKILEDNAF